MIGIMGLTFLPCNCSILVFIDIVKVLSDHALHSLSSHTLLSAFVLLFETILDGIMCIFLEHSNQCQLHACSYSSTVLSLTREVMNRKLCVWLVGKHHGIMPGKLLLYKQPSMCQSSAIQEHPALHRAYYRMLKLLCLV